MNFLIPQDKANHLICGAVIFNVMILLAHFVYADYQTLIAGLAVIFIAVGKEVNDAFINWKATGNLIKGPHGVEVLDVAATITGGVIVALPLLIVNIPA